jgi:hypothetical protein
MKDYEEYYAEYQNCLKGTGSGEELEAAHATIEGLRASIVDLHAQMRQLSTDVGQARTDGFRAGMREVQQFIGAWL